MREPPQDCSLELAGLTRDCWLPSLDSLPLSICAVCCGARAQSKTVNTITPPHPLVAKKQNVCPS